MSPTPATPLVFTLTAHERLDVLAEQIANLQTMCPRSRIVLHLNLSFMDAISSSETDGALLERIGRDPAVILNPEHIPTRWGHLFHAHISNIKLLTRLGLDYEYLMMVSSGDLLVRPGLVEFVRRYDAGVYALHPNTGTWGEPAAADPLAPTILEAAEARRFTQSAHEGSFYRSDIVERMVGMLDGIVSDWDYNDAYPKEEFFFPTLLGAFPDVSRVDSQGYQLGHSGEQDSMFVRQTLRRLGLLDASVSPLLHRWDQSSRDVEAHDYLAHFVESPPFIISRIPRRRDNLLRMLLSDVCPGGASERARFVAGRLRATDLIDLEIAGRTNKFDMTRPGLAQVLLTAATVPVIDIEQLDPGYVEEVRFEATRGYASPVETRMRSAEAPLSASIQDADAPTIVQLRRVPSGLGVARHPEAGQDRPASPAAGARLLLFTRLGPELDRSRAVRLVLEAVADGEAPFAECWIEHHDGSVKEFHHGTPVRHQDNAGEVHLWTVLPNELIQRLKAGERPGAYNLYVALEPSPTDVVVRALGLVLEAPDQIAPDATPAVPTRV